MIAINKEENYDVFEKKKEFNTSLCNSTNCSLSVHASNKVLLSCLSVSIVHEKLKGVSYWKAIICDTNRWNRKNWRTWNHAIFSLLITLTAAMCKINEKHQKIFGKNQTRLQIFAHLCCLVFCGIQTSKFFFYDFKVVVTLCAPDGNMESIVNTCLFILMSEEKQ